MSSTKMSQMALSEDRKIMDFPKPYKDTCTPYKKDDYSEVTYRKCILERKHSFSGWFKMCKIIVIGDCSVGKTCLVNRFCQKVFDSNYKSTIGVDFEVQRFFILNVPYTLQIWDTAGQERFKSIAQSYYRRAQAILLVFDLNKLDTMLHCKKWLTEALEANPFVTPLIFLAGTKADLLPNATLTSNENSATKLAEKLNAEYWTVSSKTGLNIIRLFSRVAALCFDDSVRKDYDSSKDSVKIGSTGIILNKELMDNRKLAKRKKHCCKVN